MAMELDTLLVVIKGFFFLALFGGFILYTFGHKSFHPQLGAKVFLLPAGIFWLFGMITALISTNKDPRLMAFLYSPKGDFSDDVSLFFFSLAYPFLGIALLRFAKEVIGWDKDHHNVNADEWIAKRHKNAAKWARNGASQICTDECDKKCTNRY